ncbi:Protein kinase domain-containing protein [Psidium guajava]|nr:Protein kinase domain-containing protein [Psidium guajava]
MAKELELQSHGGRKQLRDWGRRRRQRTKGQITEKGKEISRRRRIRVCSSPQPVTAVARARDRRREKRSAGGDSW